jgi:hypothetical protein
LGLLTETREKGMTGSRDLLKGNFFSLPWKQESNIQTLEPVDE